MILIVCRCSHDTVNVNLKRKPQWFLDKTPFGLVPVLELPSGDIIYESTVCNDWLNETYPSPPLYSSSSMTRAQDRIVMAHFDKVIDCSRFVRCCIFDNNNGKSKFCIAF